MRQKAQNLHQSMNDQARDDMRDGPALKVVKRGSEPEKHAMTTSKRSKAKSPEEAGRALLLCEQRLESLLALSSDWYWEQDENCRFTLSIGTSVEQGPEDTQQYIGTARWDNGGIPVGDGGSWDKHKAVLEARQPFADFVFKRLNPQGELQYISISGKPVFDGKKRFQGYCGTAKDITAPVRAEQLLRLEQAVTSSLAETDSVSAALTEVIRAICKTEGWDCGRYFRVDEDAGALRFDESWGVPDPAIQAFLERSHQRSHEVVYKPGVGLMGHVWQSGEPLWVADVTKDARALGAAFTVDVGIRGGFVFPVKSEGKTIGVLAFNSREVRDPEDRLLQAILVIGGRIGQFLKRRRAEEEQRQFRLALDNSADMIMLIDRATMRYADVNQTVCKLLGYSREELLKMGPQDLLPESRSEIEQAHDELIANPASQSGMRSNFRCKDGSIMPFESTRHVLRSGNGYIIAAVCRDIRERLAAEEAQRQQVALIAQSAEKDKLLRLFYDLPFVGLAVTSPSSKRWLQVNDYMCEMLGYSREELLGLAWTETTHPDDLPANLALFKRLAAGEFDAFQLLKRFVCKGGAIVDTTTEVRCVRRADGSVETVVTMVQNITERKRSEEALSRSEARFRSLTELSSDLYWEQDDQYRFTSIAGVGSARVNIRGFQSVGKKRWEQAYLNMSAVDWSAHMAILDAHQPFHDLELSRLDDAGKTVWIGVSGEPVFDAAGVFKGYRGVGKDITERKQGEAQIHFLANHDALTSLPNRAMFSEVLNLGIESARRYGRTFAVLFIDLDRFKVINDTLGHEAGDKLLQEMGRRLTQTVRTSDLVARLGGDEFVVLVNAVNEPKQVEAVARKILSALIKPMFIREQECRVTASIGICMFPADATDEQSLMKNADIAMYRAKEMGKNTYQFHSKEMNVHSFERMALETSLRRGLERNEFFLNYQAKLDLMTGQITGVEALVRWQHPDLGLIPPAQFIPLAEETGVIVPVGNWVLNTACAQNVAWQKEGLPPLRMAVNLSARQFADDNLLTDIAAALEKSGMKADLLELELTESMVMQHAERAGKVLTAIKKLGVRLAIDDFGVGYSSLANLKRFPIDTLKVDQSFIRDIPHDAEDKVITQAIIAMGKSLNLTVVAEGVETPEQETFLREHGCDETQGFYFSRPIAGDKFADLLRANTAAQRK
jgi:diguanylate cyclase (GGDEF)-like protein/PAS domain S-box-containing protein